MKKNNTMNSEFLHGLHRRLLAVVACLMAATVLASSVWALEPETDALLPESAPASDSATPESAPAEPALVPESTPAETPSPAPEATLAESPSPTPEATPAEAVSAPETPEVASAACLSSAEQESGGVLLDESNFPDPAFLACVRAFDTDGNGALSDAERAAVTRLDIRQKGIVSLEGIGFFPELTCLNCIGNSITELPLEQLPKLTNLLCNENRITSLDLSQTPALELLHCHDNLLSSLDVSALPHLKELACGDNPFTPLDLSHNQELAYLLYFGGPLRTLTLSNNDALIDLWCSYSLVSELDLSQAPNLQILGIERSDLRYLDLSANPHLTDVMAADNLLLAVRAGQSLPTFDLSAQRTVEVQIAAEETSYDLTRLGIPIDPACLSDVTGAQLSGTVLTGISDGSTVTYRYTDGTASFTATLLFHVSNAWLEPLTMEDWTYGEPNHSPHAVAQYGEITYLYSDSPDGTFTSAIPTDAGTWYVKAAVTADAEHAGLEALQEFHILKAQPDYTIPTNLSAVYGSTLESIQPGTGFVWETPAQPVGSVGTRTFTARFIPDDTENYLTVEGIEIPVQVTPKQASDSWVSPVTNAQNAANLTVRDGGTTLHEGVDYTLSTKESGRTVTLTVNFLGNYTGTVLRSYTVPASSAAQSPSVSSTPSQTGGQESASANPMTQNPPASSDASSAAPQTASSDLHQGNPLTAAPQTVSSDAQQSNSPAAAPQTVSSDAPQSSTPPAATSSPSTPESADVTSSGQQAESETLAPHTSFWWLLLLLLLLLLLILLLLLRNRRDPDDPDDTHET